MRIAHYFIDRPVFAAVLSILMVLVGVLALLQLPIAQYPQIAPPTISVRASYPGANAQTVSEVIAAPIEQQMSGVEGMLYVSSQSSNDGNMNMTITFEVGTDLDNAQVQVQNRIAIAEPQLPQEVQQRGVTIKKASPDLTLVVSIFSPDETRDPLYLSNFATLQLKDQLARIEGVGDINVFGARDYAMRVWLDPEKIASRGMTAGDVVQAIREQNVQVAAGIVGGPPLPAGQGTFQYTMNAQGRLVEPEEFEEIIVKVGSNGSVTRLGEIGRVQLGAAEYSSGNSFNGLPAVGLGIYQLPGSNSIATADRIYAKMRELEQRFPTGVGYAIPFDTTLFVRESIRDVVRTLFHAVVLVVIVVLVFLQNWRSAIVPLVAIPVSLIGTFAVLWAFGFSINNLSLFGLVLAVGIVVDDAIVVVENIERWIERGLSARDAAFKAMDEVTPAVIATTLGLSAVFIPVAFMSGITGQFYRQFALTISFATILSTVNSLTLSPALCALLLKTKLEEPDRLTRVINRFLGRFFGWFNRLYDRSASSYVSFLRSVVRKARISLLVYAALALLAYVGFRNVPTSFIPAQDQGYFIVNIQLPDASAINRTHEVVESLAKRIAEVDGIRGVTGIAGLSILSRSNSPSAAAMFVALNPFDERKGKDHLTLRAITGRVNELFGTLKEATAIAIPPPPVRGIGTAGGFKFQLQDRSGTGTPQDLQAMAEELAAVAVTRPELERVFTSFRANQPQIYADVDRVKAKMLDVPVTSIFEALQVYLGGLYVNDFNYLGRTWRVMAQADAPFRAVVTDVARFQTRSRDGRMVPLGSLMTLEEMTGPDRAQRYNLYLSAELNGTTAPGYSSGEGIRAMEETARQVLPERYGFEWTELAFQENLAGNTALLIFPLCILFVWLVHSAEYESFALSTAIVLIVPMCLLCGIVGVWARGMENNIFTQIGFVVLAGLSVKNAVLIVEFAKQQQERHPTMSAADAAIEAARLRLRPILMTSFAFILGVLPLVIASGAGAEMRQSLGTVVFYGMLGVTFFGIFFTPVFYKVIRRLSGERLPDAPIA